MLVKRGINETKAEKKGPTVKNGVSAKRHTKRVVCSNCRTVLEKSCTNALVCEISSMKCPNCGSTVS